MSNPHHPWASKSCPTNKIAFPSKEAGELFMSTASNTKAQRIYLCNFCDEYHMTSQTIKQNQEKLQQKRRARRGNPQKSQR